ncbi:unnamed protein product [Urochloa humidicola]
MKHQLIFLEKVLLMKHKVLVVLILPFVLLEKVKVEEAREHRKMTLELEMERLAMEQKRLQMEAEKKEKEEDECILAINLDQCQPMQHMYYKGLQEDILQKIMARRRGPSQ